MNPENQKTFVIVGLGLMGSSLGGALRRCFPKSHIIGVSRSESKIRYAKQKHYIDSGTVHLSKAVAAAGVVFICTPVDTIQRIILDIDRAAKPGTIVTDVGSTKEQLIQWIEKQKFRNISFVGSHPMAGSHLTGIDHADKTLYQHSFTFVTIHRHMNQAAFRAVISIWKKLCRLVIAVSPKHHDKIVSEISHLPHLVAALLVSVVSKKLLGYASSGFRDTTRVAAGDPRIWVPIFAANRKNLARLLSKLQTKINKLSFQLKKGSFASLQQLLRQSSLKRLELK